MSARCALVLLVCWPTIVMGQVLDAFTSKKKTLQRVSQRPMKAISPWQRDTRMPLLSKMAKRDNQLPGVTSCRAEPNEGGRFTMSDIVYAIGDSRKFQQGEDGL